MLVLNWTPRAQGLLTHLDALSERSGGGEAMDVTILAEPALMGAAERKQLLAEVDATAARTNSNVRGALRFLGATVGNGFLPSGGSGGSGNNHRHSNVRVEVLDGTALRREDLVRAGAARADTVVILRDEAVALVNSKAASWNGPGGSEGGAPDSKTFVTLSFLSDILQTEGAAEAAPATRQLVAEFHSPKAMHHARGLLLRQPSSSSSSSFAVLDLFVPEDLESGALVQIALDEALASVFDQLLSARMDLELDDLDAYYVGLGRPGGGSLTFGELAERVHASGEVLIGLQRPTKGGPTRHPRTILAPEKSLPCEPGDRLVVLRFGSHP